MKAAAVVLRKILHQQSQGMPLVKALELDLVKWYDASSKQLRPEARFHHSFALVAYELQTCEARPAYMALKGGTPISFVDWWTHAIATGTSGRQLSRQGIVSAVANRIGAHYDQDVYEEDECLFDGSFAQVKITTANGREFSMGGIAEAAIRQIAHETIVTLNHWLPQATVAPYSAMANGHAPRPLWNPLADSCGAPDMSPPRPELQRPFMLSPCWEDAPNVPPSASTT